MTIWNHIQYLIIDKVEAYYGSVLKAELNLEYMNVSIFYIYVLVLGPQFEKISPWLSNNFLEPFLWHSFLILKWIYLVMLALGVPLKRYTDSHSEWKKERKCM